MPFFRSILDTVDHRTGFRSIIKGVLYEHIPGGARWRYVWGSTLVFSFMTQLVTGLFLWMYYSPSAQTAWESVYYIQYQVGGGWLLRGIHHYTAQAMIILLALHVLQVVLDGAYRAPREFNFWVGLLLLLIVFGLGLTGYLLPWDQKGYWATKVATNLASLTPGAGEALRRVAIGGSDYGHLTLTRFFALHAGLLPGLFIMVTALHVYLFRRHGIHAKKAEGRMDTYFWSEQVLKDAVACLAVLATVLFFSFWHPAPLMAPANPSEPYSAARPEWYFLFLYQLLKFFPGESTIWGAIYIPGIVFAVLALMPLVGQARIGHAFNRFVIVALLIGSGVLTWIALQHDRQNEEYLLALRAAERDAERVHVLASTLGIPPGGAGPLLRDDAYTQGPKLFAKYCSSCHRFDGHDGTGKVPREKPSGSDLKDFGTRRWLTEFLRPEWIDHEKFFGATAFKEGDMTDFVKKTIAAYSDEEKVKLAKAVKALSAEARLKAQAELDRQDAQEIEDGRLYLTARKGEEKGLNCTRCHKFGEKGKLGRAPDLTGYGSKEWIEGLISDPSHERFYNEDNDRMPRFRTQGILDETSIGQLADWLRGEWFEPLRGNDGRVIPGQHTDGG